MVSVLGTVSTSVKKGIQIVGTEFYKDGVPFSGVGINHYALFLNSMVDMGVGGITTPNADIADIANTWGLPFIRFSTNFYDASTIYDNWYDDKTTYYARMDDVFAQAEAHNIGLIPSLFWNLIDFCEVTHTIHGTLSPPSDLADKSSNAWLLVEEYITEFVNRYKDSPSLYAWNLGNEIPNKIGVEYYSGWTPDGTDVAFVDWGDRPGGGNYTTSDMMRMVGWKTFSKNAIDLIRSLDDSGRMISSGTPLGNSFAMNAQTTDTLTADTQTQWADGFNGQPWIIFRDNTFDLTCGHIYPQSDSDSQFFNGSERTHGELIALHKQWSDAHNKAFFLEEFGATYHGDEVDKDSSDLSSETSNFNQTISAIVNNNIKLAAAWNYGGNLEGASPWMRWKMSDQARIYQLETIAGLNRHLTS